MVLMEKIIPLLGAEVQQLKSSTDIHHLLIDSRKLAFPAKALFLAIRGERHDGHHFIIDLYKKGLRNFIVEHLDFPYQNIPEANILLVKNSIEALQKLAIYHRNQFTYPIIAITGSNGKTIVKEWLSQLLQNDYKIVKSPKSYNSQVGVPLSIWQMNDWYNLGIFEAGISQMKEMIHLEKIIQPTWGIFTNIGSAHDEGFPNRWVKIQEKLKLFTQVELLFYCQDHQEIQEAVQEILIPKGIKTFTWGQKPSADLQIQTMEFSLEKTHLSFTYQGLTHHGVLPFQDAASIENALHCMAVLIYLKIDIIEIQKRLWKLSQVSMRLELKHGVNNAYLIDDSYSNDLAGLRIALDFLHAQEQKPKKVAILSDVLESGLAETELYQNLAHLLKDKGTDILIGIGEKMRHYASYFKLKKYFYEDVSKFLIDVNQKEHPIREALSQAVILSKGARIFEFEKIVYELQQKSHGTVLEINLDAVAHNLNFYRSQLKPETKLMVMVKAFAYGSGSAEIASLLQFHRVDYLGVAYVDEGIALRRNGIHLPIMVLNPDEESFEKIFQYDLEPEMYNFRILEEYLQFHQNTQNLPKNKIYKIHLNLDTGMRRLGFEMEEVEALGKYLQKYLPKHIQVASIYSHLAGADEAQHSDFSEQQIRDFQLHAQYLEEALGYPVIKHILNSPGILRFPQAQLDMVRLGVGLYGIEANQQWQDQLRFISRLKTTISQIKTIPQGATVGYGRKGSAHNLSKIATIAIGYADGFYRSLSNGKGKVLLKSSQEGQPDCLAPVIGSVCMDMTMIDITGIEAQEGDEVIIFGEEYSILEMAHQANTIPYEILTSISERVKRVFYTE